MKEEDKISRLFLVSPWFPLVFLILPFLVILSVTLHVRLPLVTGPGPLLANNICFALLAACRVVRYLGRLGKTTRYDAGHCRPKESVSLTIPIAEARQVLDNSGYSFAADGAYGEKRDFGYLGATIFYVGLLIALSAGIWDNLRQFSGTLLDGEGPPTKLSQIASYKSLHRGALAARPDTLPQMKIIRQYLPDERYPKGATEVFFISADGKELKTILVPRYPVRYGSYDIYMARLVYDAQIVIKDKNSKTLFDALVRLDPLLQKRGVFSFYGPYLGANLGGGVYYQPEKNLLKVVVSSTEKKVVSDMTFQVDQQVVQGGYVISCAKMGQWSEIHVVRRRHKGLLVFGGVIAFIGLCMRGMIRAQRVWLEETTEGCRMKATGSDAMNNFKAEG